MTNDLQYVTDEQGKRVGVLLGLEDYRAMSPSDPELLVGLSDAELEALAESKLAPSDQARLDELIARNSDSALSDEEKTELDSLLDRVDQLTIVKARARYTLHQMVGQTGT